MRVKKERPRSLKYPLDFLVALDPDTIFEHIEDVGKGTKIIYDSAIEKSDLSQARMIMKDTSERIRKELEISKEPMTVSGTINHMKKLGGIAIGVPFAEIVQKAIKGGVPSRYYNTLGAALTTAISGVDLKFLVESIKFVFLSKENVIEENVSVVKAAYDYCKEKNFTIDNLEDIKRSPRYLLTGNDGAAIGKVMGGLRFQTYYPITPASDESSIIEDHEDLKWINEENSKLSKSGVAIVQTEDEISAIAMASGAAITGARASTATSGPGFSLMAEAISFAGTDEIPIVITLYQRGGPSTGLPTRNGQSDLLFALNTGHGEFPKMVISSGDVEECIYDSMRALNYAQRYQLPVIHLIDKNLANTTDFIPEINSKLVKVPQFARISHSPEWRRYSLGPDTGISEFGVFGKDIFWMTGDEHDELGHVTEDSEIRDRMMVKRFRKLEVAMAEIPLSEMAILYGSEKADITFVTWGSQKGPILDVMEMLESEGKKCNLLYLKMFQPFPSEFVTKVLSEAKIIIDVESNMLGQAATVIRSNTGINIGRRILKYNGRHMTEDEILDATRTIIGTKKETIEVVLKHGA
ncbi:pyruvate-ferredoxin oxidoreductase [mine drainage metagenome]|uniref:Pyruvate-ferredoxin oxidoreductase n=1 Tax=mine drainage metagenome TaxID=410659 RepID=T0ZLW5_9ZZZZ